MSSGLATGREEAVFSCLQRLVDGRLAGHEGATDVVIVGIGTSSVKNGREERMIAMSGRANGEMSDIIRFPGQNQKADFGSNTIGIGVNNG